MKKKSHPMTAAEAMAKRSKDPSFIARQQEQERIRLERETQSRAVQKPLLEELKKVGINIESVWDLVNTSSQYDDAIPILFCHLQKPYPDKEKEGIARALGVPKAIVGWNILVTEFRNATETSSRSTKMGLAAAIGAIATDAVIGDVIDLVQNKNHGENRILLLKALRRSKKPEAASALNNLASDPDLAKEIASWRMKRAQSENT